MHLPPVSIGGEPLPSVCVLGVGGVVLDQNGPPPTIASRQLFLKGELGGGVEDGVLPAMETGVAQFDGAQDLPALALSRHRDFGRVADPAPGGMQRGVLTETSCVGEEQCPAFGGGFLVRFG